MCVTLTCTQDVQRPGDYVVNLIHYEDAARIAVAVGGLGCRLLPEHHTFNSFPPQAS
jgi:hypothetical protein